MKHLILAAVMLVVPLTLRAQPAETLPAKLSGHMTASGATQTFILDLAMVFDGERKPGPITGRVTHQGVNCGAQNEPLTGTWDGAELRVEARLHANVNALRMGGQCDGAKVTYVLKRKAGTADFAGEVRANTTSSVATIVLSP